MVVVDVKEVEICDVDSSVFVKILMDGAELTLRFRAPIAKAAGEAMISAAHRADKDLK